jgi:hypothetical protein
MATREVVTLNETTPQLEVPQAGDTYEMPRDVNITGDLTVTGSIPAHNQAWSTITTTPTTLAGYAISDTKANFNTACSDGTFLFAGDVSGGWANMTEAVWTGGTQSEVANGATAIGFNFDTDAAYSTTGAKIAAFGTGGTEKIAISKDGGLSLNSGATTAAHSQSLNMNWSSSGTDTSSGLHSVVIGKDNKANSSYSVAIGENNVAWGEHLAVFGLSNVSNGLYSFTCGNANTGYGVASLTAGKSNTASGFGSITSGNEANNNQKLTFALGAKMFAAVGDAQIQTSPLKIATTDATQATMTCYDGVYIIPADTTWAFSALIAARSNEADGNEQAVWEIKGCLGRDESNNTALVGTPVVSQLAASTNAIADGWAVVAEADDVNEALAIKVTGAAATNIRWVAKVDISQVSFA